MSFGNTHRGRAAYLPDCYVEHMKKIYRLDAEDGREHNKLRKSVQKAPSKKLLRRQRSRSLDDVTDQIKFPDISGENTPSRSDIFNSSISKPSTTRNDHGAPPLTSNTIKVVAADPFSRLYRQGTGNIRAECHPTHHTHDEISCSGEHGGRRSVVSGSACSANDEYRQLHSSSSQHSPNGPASLLSSTLHSPLNNAVRKASRGRALATSSHQACSSDRLATVRFAKSTPNEMTNRSAAQTSAEGTVDTTTRGRDSALRRRSGGGKPALFRQRSRSLDSSPSRAVVVAATHQQTMPGQTLEPIASSLASTGTAVTVSSTSTNSEHDAESKNHPRAREGKLTNKLRISCPSRLDATFSVAKSQVRRNSALAECATGSLPCKGVANNKRKSVCEKRGPLVVETRVSLPNRTSRSGRGGSTSGDKCVSCPTSRRSSAQPGQESVLRRLRAKDSWKRAVVRISFIIKFLDIGSSPDAHKGDASADDPQPTLVFKGPKLFWRLRCSVLVYVYEHPSCDCMEIVVEDVDKILTFDRLYVQPSALLNAKREHIDRMLRVIIEHRPDLIKRSERSCLAEFIVNNLTVVGKGSNSDSVNLELKQYNDNTLAIDVFSIALPNGLTPARVDTEAPSSASPLH